MVLFVCRLVDSKQLFSAVPCVLSQAVLLSLIQQLSADLTMSTDIKLEWVENSRLLIKTVLSRHWHYKLLTQLPPRGHSGRWLSRSGVQRARSECHCCSHPSTARSAGQSACRWPHDPPAAHVAPYCSVVAEGSVRRELLSKHRNNTHNFLFEEGLNQDFGLEA